MGFSLSGSLAAFDASKQESFKDKLSIHLEVSKNDIQISFTDTSFRRSRRLGAQFTVDATVVMPSVAAADSKAAGLSNANTGQLSQDLGIAADFPINAQPSPAMRSIQSG